MPRVTIRTAAWLLAILWICGSTTGATSPTMTANRDGVAFEPRSETSHAYRIIGKVRILFFWVSASDVGGARVTWRDDGHSRSVSLLIGSEPSRAPRGVNEWGYIREEAADDVTTVFGIRTETDGDSPAEADRRRPRAGGVAEIGALCSRITNTEAQSRTATVFVPPALTFRDFARVLGDIEQHERWNSRGAARPPGSAPGFLTALDSMLRTTATARSVHPQRLAYVYKDTVYDLIPHGVERIEQLRTASGVVRNVVSTDVTIRNRRTGSTSSFSIAYGTDGAFAGIPVRAAYQPNWWFKVELELNDAQDMPLDPATDTSISRRLADLCRR